MDYPDKVEIPTENQKYQFKHLLLPEGLIQSPESQHLAETLDYLLKGVHLLNTLANRSCQNPLETTDLKTVIDDRGKQLEEQLSVLKYLGGAISNLPGLSDLMLSDENINKVIQNEEEKELARLHKLAAESKERSARETIDQIAVDLDDEAAEVLEVKNTADLQSMMAMLEYSIRHDLNSPLTVIRGTIELLLKAGKNSNHPRSQALPENINNGYQKLLRYTDEDIPKLLKDLFPHQEIPIEIILQSLSKDLLSDLETEGTKVRLNPIPEAVKGVSINYAQHLLKPLLRNISHNIAKAYLLKYEAAVAQAQAENSEPQFELETVNISFQRLQDELKDNRYQIPLEKLRQFSKDEYLLMVIEDNAIGFPDILLSKGFQNGLSIFYDLGEATGSTEVTGTGKGMYGQQEILSKYGGGFILQNRTDTQGARLIVALPIHNKAM